MAYDGSLKFDTKVDSSGFKSGIEKLGSIAKTGLKVAVTAIGAVSTAITTAGGFAIKTGSDFEAGMSQVSAISGAVGKDLDALTEKAKEMGAKTKFTAAESAEAFNYMAMAGWKTDDMLGGIEGIMNLAAASGENLATVSDICTDALTAFGLQASDSAHFADVLAKASSNSNTNVGMMGATFKYVAPIAGSMKYSIEDTAVAIGLMANAGIKGEQAGTSLRAMLTRLVDPPADAADAMEALGLSVTNADGTMRPLNDVIKDMREKFAGLDDSQKASYASSIAGTEAMSGLLAIVNASDEDFQNLTDSIGNADGAAQDMAETIQDNLQGKITILKSSIEGLGIEVYESMQEPLKEAVEIGIDYVGQLTEAFQHGGLQEAVEEAGGIFAELAVKAAEKAPDMVDAAVGFIQSFIKGIGDNAPQLIQAAKQIVGTLVDGLVKLLPSEIQKPVKETVDILKRSFESGGLRNAINTVSNILKNLGKVVTNLAKTILPPLAKAVDFLGQNIKIILPLVAEAVVGIKAFKIVQSATKWFDAMKTAIAAAGAATSAEALATAASTGAITLKQIAVGVLTGEIGLVTAAQWLWNAAMSANTIGVVIGLVAALAAGIGLLCVALDDGKSGEEQLAEANQALGDSFGDVGQAAADFYDGIQNAESRLSQFNDTLFASAEEQQALQDNMQEVQDGITTICKTAAEERRGYTEQEILQLDEYFAKMREIADAQLAIQEAKSDAIRQQAVNEAQAFKGSLGEYQLTAQEWIKTAQDQADQQISLIEEQTTTELTLLNQKYGNQANMANEAYKAEYDELMARKDASIQAANEEVGAVSSAYQNGYLQRTEHLQAFLDKTKELKGQEEAEEQRYNDRIKELKDELKAIEDDETLSYNDKARLRYMKQDEIQRETDGHYAKLSEIQDKYNEGLSDDVKDELGSWMAMLAQTEQYGGYISEENKKTFDGILDKIDEMPPETRDAMKNAMSPMLDEMKNAEPGLFEKAAGIAGGILNRLKSAFDIHSPSRKTRKIFRQVLEGAEGGFEDEEPKLLNQTAGIADDILKRFQLSKLDVSGMVQKMKAAVAAESYRMSASLSASGNYEVVRDSRYGSETDSNVSDGKYVAEIHVDLEGREVARATAPFMGEQLAWEG